MGVVLVTGSSRGLGREIALTYAKNGFDVIIHYQKEEQKAKDVAFLIEKEYKRKVLVVKADLRKEEEIDMMCQKIKQTFPMIDVLVNNAAISHDTLFSSKTKELFMDTLEVNLVGAFLLSKKVASCLMSVGCILFISSSNALDTPYIEGLDYDASKAGLISLTHNLAKYFAPSIRVNAICPGWIETDMSHSISLEMRKEEEKKILLGRFAKVEEIAPLVYFLGTKEASYINDSIIRIDGGVLR